MLPLSAALASREVLHISTTSGPVNVNILANLVLLIGKLRLHVKRLSTDVITLSLEKIGREVLVAVTVEPGKGDEKAEVCRGERPWRHFASLVKPYG
jgi:hypothetical protein